MDTKIKYEVYGKTTTGKFRRWFAATDKDLKSVVSATDWSGNPSVVPVTEEMNNLLELFFVKRRPTSVCTATAQARLLPKSVLVVK